MSEPSPRRSFLTPRGIVLIAVLVAMLFSSVYPLGRYLSVRGEIDQLEQLEAELRSEAVALAREKQTLTDPDEIERLARERLGFVRPGEVPFAIVGEPDPAEVPAKIAPDGPADDGTPGVLARWWDAMRTAVTAPL